MRVVVGILLIAFVVGCSSKPSAVTSREPVDFPAPDAARGEVLVSAHWVKKVLDYQALDERARQSTAPPVSLNKDHLPIVVLECSWATLDKADIYHAGHLPGAIHLNTDDLENGYPTWLLKSPAELHALLGRLGISNHSTVIVYGDKTIAAARVWWVLTYAGVADVRLLDGGFDAWKQAGFAEDRTTHHATPADFSRPIRAMMIADTTYVADCVARRTSQLVDVRSEAEFIGAKSGYSYLDAKGRIPNSIFADDADDTSFIYKDRSGRLKPLAEILHLWQISGVQINGAGSKSSPATAPREIVFYCGSGWRSSLTFFYAHLAGIDQVRNYSDGWCGWSTQYVPDKSAEGNTPGWRQVPTGRTFLVGKP